jgi:PAS domain S-box-containing protein
MVPDAAVRLKVTGLLQRHGCEVHACDDFGGGSALYDAQDIIVAPMNGDDRELTGFVEQVRTTSGDAQPYILGLVSGSAVALEGDAAHYGINDVLPWPLDAGRLTTRLGAIVRECLERPAACHANAPHDGWSSPASQALLEQLPSAVAVLDREMTYLAANQRWRREFQVAGMQVTGQSHYQLFPDLHPAWRELYARCLAGHRERSDDDLLVRPDGSQDWVRWDIQPWRNASGETGGLILTCTVVTGRRREPLPAAFERNLAHSLLNNPAVPVVIVDHAGRILRANTAARRLAPGFSLTEGRTFFWNALIPAAHRDPARQRVLDLLTLADSGRHEAWPMAGGEHLATLARTGEAAGASWSVFPNRSADGSLAGLIFLGLHSAPNRSLAAMTEEATLLAAAPAAPDETRGEEFRQIAEAAPFGMIVLSDEAEVLYANPQHRSVLGFSVTECGGMMSWLERACAADDECKRRALEEWWERVWRRRAAWTCSMRTVDGILKEVEFRPAQLPGHKLLLTIFDVTDAQLEEQAIRASEARYRGLFQNCAAGVAVLNSSGNITEVNPAFEELTGCSRHEIRRSGLGAFLPEEHLALVCHAVAAAEPGEEIITSIRAKDGTLTRAALSLSVLKNDDGVAVYTACYLHPLPPEGPPPHAWRGADWSRSVPDCVLLMDGSGRILERSDARDFSGVLPRGDAMTGRTLEETVPAIADLLPIDVMMERLKENPHAETRCEFSTTLVPGGRARFIEARMVLLGQPGDGERYGLVLRDLTAVASRPAAPGSGALPWLRNLSTPVLLSNERGRITGMNPAAEQLLGWNAAELEGNGLFRIFRPDNPKSFSEQISGELTRHRCWKAAATFHRKDGSTGVAEVELVPAHDEATGSRGFITLFRSAPAGKPPPGAAADPDRSVVTLHHARNDLQILTSLLALQAEEAGGYSDSAIRAALSAARDRLNAVALVYRLLRSEDDTVDASRYAAELGDLLLESRHVPPDRIRIDTAVEPAGLPQRTAITLGIIMEELIIASLAGFAPDEEGGIIRVSLTTGGGEGVLIVRDNASVPTEALRQSRMDSPSWKVVQMLSDQIGGVLTLLADLENQVRLRFRINPQQ